jgi:hypothetical protein
MQPETLAGKAFPINFYRINLISNKIEHALIINSPYNLKFKYF